VFYPAPAWSPTSCSTWPPGRAKAPSGSRYVSAIAGEAPSRQLDPERLGDHLDRLYRAALGLCGSAADADDLVQETYLQVLRKPRLLRSQDDLGYLIRVLRNTFYSRHRAEARRPRTTELADDFGAETGLGGPSPEDVLASREVLAAVAGLPEPFRETVAAVDLAGLSYKEAARALGANQGTIMSRLYRGREQVADALGRPGA
jgi:RNA polymerase sigma-70 factor (ECF subfamily)